MSRHVADAMFSNDDDYDNEPDWRNAVFDRSAVDRLGALIMLLLCAQVLHVVIDSECAHRVTRTALGFVSGVHTLELWLAGDVLLELCLTRWFEK